MADIPSETRSCGSSASGFLRDLVHEFASPLNSMSMNVEILETLLPQNANALIRDAIDRLTQDRSRLERLLYGLRAYADALKRSPRETIALGELIEQAQSQAVSEGAPPVRIVTNNSQALLSIDCAACSRAVAAILCNAAEAGASEVTVTAEEEPPMTCLYFDDDGQGIEANQRTRVLEPFFSLHADSTHAGLGLAMARAVVFAHHGDIEVLAGPGRGTRLVVRMRTLSRNETA